MAIILALPSGQISQSLEILAIQPDSQTIRLLGSPIPQRLEQ